MGIVAVLDHPEPEKVARFPLTAADVGIDRQVFPADTMIFDNIIIIIYGSLLFGIVNLDRKFKLILLVSI